MATEEPGKATVWSLRILSMVLFYAALTLGVATVFAVASSPNDPFASIGIRLTAPLYAALPGTTLWSSVLDLRGKIGSVFPTPLAVMLGLIVAAAGSWAWAKNINKQIRSDVATARDETIRLEVRAKTQPSRGTRQT